MIENPENAVDRLSALTRALRIAAHPGDAGAPGPALGVYGPAEAPERARLRLRGAEKGGEAPLAAARLVFSGPAETLLAGAPEVVDVALADCPPLAGLAGVFALEATAPRCGGREALARIAEAMTVIALRRAVEAAPPERGLLAGLAHPRLHRALVAIHEAPEAGWRVDALAARAGMSRSRFLAVFGAVMGATPAVYVARLRLLDAQAALAAGRSVKEAARRAGYGSTAAFSRAYRRAFDAPPSAMTRAMTGARRAA